MVRIFLPFFGKGKEGSSLFEGGELLFTDSSGSREKIHIRIILLILSKKLNRIQYEVFIIPSVRLVIANYHRLGEMRQQ
jgi:hypothetical protein